MKNPNTEELLVLCNVPDSEVARRIASALVEERFAACVNILRECRSIYIWEGAVEDEREIPLLIKTTAARFAQTRDRIVDLHPYDVPEIIAVPIADGYGPYLEFIRQACAASAA